MTPERDEVHTMASSRHASPTLARMNGPQQLNSLRAKLEQLRLEHRDLDEVVTRLGSLRDVDQLQLRRLKKRKLYLKDQIERLRSLLIPNLDA
jgi:hypothetical protein